MRVRAWMLLSLWVALAGSAACAQSLYERGNTWDRTLLSSRARYAEWRGQLSMETGPWWATAPLAAPKFTDVLFPELKVDLDLRQGRNALLMKIHNNAGAHAFYFSLGRDPLLRIWAEFEGDFPIEARRLKRDLPRGRHLAWFQESPKAEVSRELVGGLIDSLGIRGGFVRETFDLLCDKSVPSDDPGWLKTYAMACWIRSGIEDLASFNAPAVRLAITDLIATFGDEFRRGEEFLREIESLTGVIPALQEMLTNADLIEARTALEKVADLLELKSTALLANPLLDFDRLLLVKRKAGSPKLGLPQNWQGNCSLPRSGFDDEIAILSPVSPAGSLSTFFKPERPCMVADVDLHFDADRMLFSMLGSNDRWQIYEIGADGTGLRQVTPGREPDVDNYDACYLPDGRIIFDSTRCFQGIPCVGGADAVANLFIMDDHGGNVRQLCFDQDHDWCPTVLNDGRVLYTRWEYSDTPHYFSRLLFHMNPDGTGQAEHYGSNSFWPNSLFYARPIPGHPSMVAGIVSGHHGVARMGELILFDPAKGRFEADGVLQRIPGYGKKVEPVIVDQLVDGSWPKFLHPYPLSDKYFLAACRPTREDGWGIYLVDVFDNMLLLCDAPGHALLEPIPFRDVERPPIIPDRVQLNRDDAVVYLANVYAGPGLEGVPRGTVKSLRVYEFHYTYPQMGGHCHIGIEGPWDVHRILGTVPVYEDGSACFKVPANTPIAVQPLDSEGKAVQVMRSWFTAMPGEVLSCVGCHERQNTAPPARPALAARSEPVEIAPWRGPARGFSFSREVQPVLDQHCIGCHDGRPWKGGDALADLTVKTEGGWRNFTPAYIALHPYVYRPGPESDYHLQPPMEFHADTSELIQMLAKGHHGVRLDEEAWDRLVTWIDLNVPDHGTWGEHAKIKTDFVARRVEMRTRHANRPEDPEQILAAHMEPIPSSLPRPLARPEPLDPECPGWPFDAGQALERRADAGFPEKIALDLGDGVTMELVLVPAGEFVIGDASGCDDELPRSRVSIERPVYMGAFEVTREQYSRFDPDHHNGYIDQRHKDHTTPGYPANDPDHSVIRISWEHAVAFCEWLSEKTGRSCALPTEAQWEWACRAGSDGPFFYGDQDTDFSAYANLADQSIRLLAVTGVNPQPIPNPSPYEDYLPKDERFDDGERIMSHVGKYRPNAWGLHDMHGNVWEWTRSSYRPYPYAEDDGRNDPRADGKRVARGGSWRDRPKRARSGYRLAYRPYQRVFNVGFRVVVSVH